MTDKICQVSTIFDNFCNLVKKMMISGPWFKPTVMLIAPRISRHVVFVQKPGMKFAKNIMDILTIKLEQYRNLLWQFIWLAGKFTARTVKPFTAPRSLKVPQNR